MCTLASDQLWICRYAARFSKFFNHHSPLHNQSFVDSCAKLNL